MHLLGRLLFFSIQNYKPREGLEGMNTSTSSLPSNPSSTKANTPDQQWLVGGVCFWGGEVKYLFLLRLREGWSHHRAWASWA